MLYGVFIPVLLTFIPWVLVRYVFTTKETRNLPYLRHAWFLWIASVLWVTSQLAPNIPISVETDTFSMHTLGGAVAAVLYVYALRVYKVRFEAWWQPLIGLFLFASGLGVLNELFEFFLSATGLAEVVGGDEWWDLFANTIGSFTAYGIVMTINRISRRK